jgi:hypothetical protein
MKAATDSVALIQFKVIFAWLLTLAAREYIYAHVDVFPKPRGARGGKSWMNRCWAWRGCNDGRYGHAYFLGRRFKAHILAYLAFVGFIRRHHVIDHDPCNNTRCCNPFHLKAVTQSNNLKRAFAIGNLKPPRRQTSHIVIDEMETLS